MVSTPRTTGPSAKRAVWVNCVQLFRLASPNTRAAGIKKFFMFQIWLQGITRAGSACVHIKRGSLQVEQVTAVLKRFGTKISSVMVDWCRGLSDKSKGGGPPERPHRPRDQRNSRPSDGPPCARRARSASASKAVRAGPVAPDFGFIVGQRAHNDGWRQRLHVPMLGYGQRQLSFRDDLIAVPRFGEHADHETRHEHGESQFVDGMRLGRNVPQAFRVRSVAVRIELHVAEIHRPPSATEPKNPLARTT